MAKRLKISKAWLIAGLLAVGLSIILAVLIVPKMNTDAMLPYAIVGYVLTPFAASAALVLARAQDLRYQANPLYLRSDGRTMISRVGLVVAVSFIPAIVHILYIAGYVGSMLA